MEPIWKGKQTNKTSNMCAGDKGKETNKQTSRGGMCGGMDAGGDAELHNMRSLIRNASEYVEELRRCIRDASEKCRVQYAGSYSDTNLSPSSFMTQASCSCIQLVVEISR